MLNFCVSSLPVDQIYHLASPASPVKYMYNPVKTIKTNTIGTLNMLGTQDMVTLWYLVCYHHAHTCMCYSMLCCVTPCYVVLLHAMLCYYHAMLCYSVLCCVTPCYVVLLHAMLCYSMLCCATICYYHPHVVLLPCAPKHVLLLAHVVLLPCAPKHVLLLAHVVLLPCARRVTIY